MGSAGLAAVGAIADAAGRRAARLTEGAPTPELSLPDFRASGDRDDGPAFDRALARLAPTGGVLRLPARRGLGEGGAYRASRGVPMDVSGLILAGEGQGETVIEAPDASVLASPTRAVAGVRIADLTLRGGRVEPIYWNGRFAAARFAFQRMTLLAPADAALNCVHIVHDHQGTTEDFDWVDCTFRGGGRMAVEIQNHRHDIVATDRVPRYRGYRFVRPRVLDHAAMGLSFSGSGDGIEVLDPVFERIGAALVEGVGCSNLLIRNLQVLADDLRGDDALIRCSNRFVSRDVEVDGLTIVARRGPATVSRPIIRMDNARRFKVSRVRASVVHPKATIKAVDLGVAHPCDQGVITGCDLSTNGPFVIGSEGCTNLRVHGNRLRSTAAGDVEAVRTVGTSGPSSTLVGANDYAAPRARSFKPLVLAANATGRVAAR